MYGLHMPYHQHKIRYDFLRLFKKSYRPVTSMKRIKHTVTIAKLRMSIEKYGIKRTMKTFHLGRHRILEICKLEGISVFTRGRPTRIINETEIQFYTNYKSRYH